MRHLFCVLFTLVWAEHVVAQNLLRDETARMQAADIVILGEIHDNPLHHQGQAQLMAQIAPKAVVFEMLTPFMANQVNAYAADDLRPLGSELGWEDTGWPDFQIYLPVFETLGEASAVGAALPRGTVRRAFAEGAAAVFEGDAARFGLVAALPEAEAAARREMQFNAHCDAMPREMMGGMVEAQRLRDAHFAARTLLALEAYGGPVVVIAGNGHARKDWGMPHALGRAAPDRTVFSVGFIEEPGEADDVRFDVTIVTPTTARPDPCAAFKN